MTENIRYCTHVSVQFQVHNSKNQNTSDYDVMQFAMQGILNLLECVLHWKTLQDLSNTFYKNSKNLSQN